MRHLGLAQRRLDHVLQDMADPAGARGQPQRSCRDVAASLATSATRMSGPSALVNERTSAQRGAPVGNAE